MAGKKITHSSKDLPFEQQLHKWLARSGLASRRQANRWLEEGRLTVNGQVAPPWISVTRKDQIKLDGRLIALSESEPNSRILIYNKPSGMLCSRSDPQGRVLVFDQLPVLDSGRWVSVGRLDFTSTGLLILTNDGRLAHKLMHPSSGIDREYAVRVLGKVTDSMLDRLRKGVELDNGFARFSDVRFYGGEGANSWYHVTLMSGRKNEVRRLWDSQGIRVSRLKRVRFGPVVVPSVLSVGRLAEFKPYEVAALYRLVGLTPQGIAITRSKLASELPKSKLLIAYPGLP